jgi:hypothetical protein
MILPDTSDSPRARSWLCLGFLVAAHAIFNICISPFEGGPTFFNLLVMGVILSQPVLFAGWATIGPPPASKRLPLTIAAFAAVILSGGMTSDEWLSLNYLLIALTFFVVAIAAMLVIAWRLRWSIRQTRGPEAGDMPLNQFSLKFLLAVTTISAALLGIGRALASRQDWGRTQGWQSDVLEMIGPIGYLLLALLPALIAPTLVLSPRPKLYVMVTIPIVWIGLTVLAVETIVALEGPSRWDVVKDVVVLQLGSSMAGILTTVVLRIAGYRLFRRQSTLA